MWVLVTGDLFSAKVRNSTLKCKIVYNIIRIVSQCLRTARSRVLSSYLAASLFWWVWPLIKLSTYILTTTRLVILIVQFICITQHQSQNPRKMKKFPFLMILIVADYDYDDSNVMFVLTTTTMIMITRLRWFIYYCSVKRIPWHIRIFLLKLFF